MMTKESMKFAEETKKFNQAVDLFFGMNPEKRLWILLMLYLGKERSLHLVTTLNLRYTQRINHVKNHIGM